MKNHKYFFKIYNKTAALKKVYCIKENVSLQKQGNSHDDSNVALIRLLGHQKYCIQ